MQHLLGHPAPGGVDAVAFLVEVVRGWDALARRRGMRCLDDGRPARISTALAAVSFSGLTVLVTTGLDTPVLWASVVVLSAALVAEAVVGACIPCELVVWAARRGLLRFRAPIGTTR